MGRIAPRCVGSVPLNGLSGGTIDHVERSVHDLPECLLDLVGVLKHSRNVAFALLDDQFERDRIDQCDLRQAQKHLPGTVWA